jgi:hypothetical protein
MEVAINRSGAMSSHLAPAILVKSFKERSVAAHNIKTVFHFICRLLLVALCSAFCSQLYAEEPSADYNVQTLVSIPTRDGIHLSATLYRPVQTKEALPVIFQFTPYPDDGSPSGSYFAAHGYIFAAVYVRGRGDSEGQFDPYVHDGQDGFDVVEWFAKQSWCNGKIGMFGGSYEGADQWLVAATHPPHLTTIVPTASARAVNDYPGQQRIVMSYMTQWLTYTSGHVLYSKVFRDPLWEAADRRWYLDKAAFRDLDLYTTGNRSKLFQSLLQHPDLDDFWRARGGSPQQIAGVNIPLLEITGTHDGDENGALSFHGEHNASAENAGKIYLVIGPWDHRGTRKPGQDIGGEHYGPASMVDVLQLQREWFDYTMKGTAKPAFLQDHLVYYVAGPGAECWKSAGSQQQAVSHSLTLYLDAHGGAESVYHSGFLSPTPEGTEGGAWLSDPNDLSGSTPFDPEAVDPNIQPGDDLHGNGLVFHSAPFSEAIEITGKVNLNLSLSIDAPDTDLLAELSLVLPDGKVRMLTNSLMRARYRNSEDIQKPFTKIKQRNMT